MHTYPLLKNLRPILCNRAPACLATVLNLEIIFLEDHHIYVNEEDRSILTAYSGWTAWWVGALGDFLNYTFVNALVTVGTLKQQTILFV